MSLGEFELIGRFLSGLDRGDQVLLGLGDDAALVDVGGAEALAVCVDTLVAGVHFPDDAPPDAVGHKLLAVNLSDLAAMGARPAFALLALTLPSPEADWLAGFRAGFQALAEAHGVALIGGDTTRGGLSLSLTLAGWVEPERALRRDRARVGDLVYVTGSLGDAAAGLRLWQAGRGEIDDHARALVARLHRPTPRLAAGRALRQFAHAAVDISDGLAADLGHVLTRSGVGACIELERLPLSTTLRARCSPAEAAVFALGGGDDYELCFTAPAAEADRIAELARALDLPMTAIGRVEAEHGLRVVGPDGQPLPLARAGFDHFGSRP